MKKSSPFLKQAILLIFLMLLGVVMALSLTALALSLSRYIPMSEAVGAMSGENEVAFLRLLQTMQSLLVFILPAVLLPVFCRENVSEALSWRASQHQPAKDALMTVLSMVVLLPLVSVLAEWNAAIRLPDGMSGIESWMRESADNAEAAVGMLMGEGSLGDFLICVLIIAFLAAVSEEWLFRGSLLGLIRKALPGNNPKRDYVVAIWITATVFSAFHLQFDGFFPRLLLGAWLGYLLMWTRSIWIPVLAHFTNNMIALLSMFAVKWGWVTEPIEDRLFSLDGQGLMCLIYTVIPLVLILLIARYFRSEPCK